MSLKDIVRNPLRRAGFDVVRFTPEFNRPFPVLPLLVRERLQRDPHFFIVQVGANDGVLDPGCLVSSLSSVSIAPGEIAQPIHADDQMIPLPKPHPAVVCNSMWALTDFTDANGATRIIPGSHLAHRSPDYGSHYDSIAAEMPRGSVLVWHGSLWHGGGANHTDKRRVGIAMNYCAGYLRQQENQQLGLPPELVEAFEPRLRDLVGYGTYMGLIGHIDRRTPAKRYFGSASDNGGAQPATER